MLIYVRPPAPMPANARAPGRAVTTARVPAHAGSHAAKGGGYSCICYWVVTCTLFVTEHRMSLVAHCLTKTEQRV